MQAQYIGQSRIIQAIFILNGNFSQTLTKIKSSLRPDKKDNISAYVENALNSINIT